MTTRWACLVLCFIACAQLACSQPGDGVRPADAPAQSDSKQLKPAVPPVPDSPLKANCAKLPTQVERDTCTNRKESTG